MELVHVNETKMNTPPEIDKELTVNGMSFILYDTIVLNSPLPSEDMKKLLFEDSYFRPVCSKSDYIEKYLYVDAEQKNNHVVLESKETIEIETVNLVNGITEKFYLALHFTIYSRQFILIQVIGQIDNRGISQWLNSQSKTRMKDYSNNIIPLRTDDILKLLDEFVPDESYLPEGSYRKIIQDKKEAQVNRLLRRVNRDENGYETLSSRARQPIAIQIWDINNDEIKRDNPGGIKGPEIAKRFKWELSAILSFYTDHVRRRGNWRNCNPDDIKIINEKTTGVLKDHRVLFNERLCVEISQIDHPEFSTVSQQRLSSFGYDSTSIFFWGYLNLQEAMCELYENKIFGYMGDIDRTLSSWTMGKPVECRQDGETDKSKILKQFLSYRLDMVEAINRHFSIWKLCKEDRHRKFLNDNSELRKIQDKVFELKKSLDHATNMAMDFSQVLLAIHLENANKAQSKTALRLNLISIMIGAMGIGSLTEFISGFQCVGPGWKGPVAISLTFIVICVIFFALISEKRKS